MFKKMIGISLLVPFISFSLFAEPGNPGKGKKGPNCDKVFQTLRKSADGCLKMKNPEKRKGCFDKIGEKAETSPEECRGGIDPIRNEFMEKEKQMYPQGQSSMGEGGNHGGRREGEPSQHGHQHGPDQGPGEGWKNQNEGGTHGDMNRPGDMYKPGDMHKPGGDPNHRPGHDPKAMGPHQERGQGKPQGEDCMKIADKVRNEANKCLKMKNRDKRQACMDKVGEHVERSPEECRGGAIEPVKMEVMEKEKQTYPDQEPTVR